MILQEPSARQWIKAGESYIYKLFFYFYFLMVSFFSFKNILSNRNSFGLNGIK